MSGASTARAPLSNASTRRAKPTATSVVAPPARTACPQRHRLVADPGQEVVGEDDLLPGDAARTPRRGLLLDDGGAARRGRRPAPSASGIAQPSTATGSPGRSTNSRSSAL